MQKLIYDEAIMQLPSNWRPVVFQKCTSWQDGIETTVMKRVKVDKVDKMEW